MTRTLKTEYKVVANSLDEAQEWIDNNMDTIWAQELEQLNVIDDDRELQEDKPSQNEAEELQDLAGHIGHYLHTYRHVEAYIPKEMWDALEKMSSHVTED
jgi:hypothetical protein